MRLLRTLIPSLTYPLEAILSPTPISRPANLITSRYCLDVAGYTTEFVSNAPSKDSVSTVSLPPTLFVTAASVLMKLVGVAVAPLVYPLNGISSSNPPLRSMI